MVLVVGAMIEELEIIIQSFDLKPVVNSAFKEFQTADQKLVVCATGIGTVNAAAGLSYLLTKHQKIDYVLVLGTAGAISPELKQGDIVLIEKAIYAQVDVRAFNYQLGQVPKMPSDYLADESLTSQIISQLQAQWSLKLVNAATLDLFVENKKQVKNLIAPLPISTKIAEMEIASYYQVAYLFGIPIVAIKIITDSIMSNKTTKLEFNQFLPKAAHELAEILRIILKKNV